MLAKPRSKIQQERDRATISELYLRGWTQAKIGEYLELNQSNVSRELAKVKAAWKQQAVRDCELHVAEQLGRLSMIEAEHWAAWERSQTAKEQSLQEKLSEAASNGDSKTKVQRKTEARIGDPRFLEQLLKCSQERSKLLNLYPSDDREPGNATAAGRSIGGGLSGDTVNSIRAEILGVTYYGQPNRAEPNFAESNNAIPIGLPTGMAR